MVGVYTVNQTPFGGGEIITANQITENYHIWFGFPKSLIDIFLQTKKVETANRYLKDIGIPWRVSTINIVDGSTQWTIA